jgi:hypothetical protein
LGQHAGDFVLSFGGYGPNYHKPSHYPDVPRLSFVWRVSDELNVTGWNYFALTPSSVQAGGGLSITFDDDPLHAWCHLQADFFLQWKPFFYFIDISVDFGVKFRQHLLFCTVSVSADISADLTIWGPDFSGHAELDMWFVSFGVDFGADAPDHPPSVDWNGFVSTLVVPPAPGSHSLHAEGLHSQGLHAEAVLRDSAPVLTSQPVQFVSLAGLTKTTDAGIDYLADPACTSINIVTTMPAQSATLNGAAVNPSVAVAAAIHARPVDGSPVINPTLSVTIAAKSGDAENLLAWSPAAVVRQVPSALWGSPMDGEMISAVTSLRLTVTIEAPDQLGPIEQSILLVNTETPPISLAWQSPWIPEQQPFDWSKDGPFATMKVTTIKSDLAPLVAAGYLAQSALDAIDLSFMTATEPCFMAHPILANLGAETYAEAA